MTRLWLILFILLLCHHICTAPGVPDSSCDDWKCDQYTRSDPHERWYWDRCVANNDLYNSEESISNGWKFCVYCSQKSNGYCYCATEKICDSLFYGAGSFCIVIGVIGSIIGFYKFISITYKSRKSSKDNHIKIDHIEHIPMTETEKINRGFNINTNSNENTDIQITRNNYRNTQFRNTHFQKIECDRCGETTHASEECPHFKKPRMKIEKKSKKIQKKGVDWFWCARKCMQIDCWFFCGMFYCCISLFG
eukprot:344997_1